MTKVTQDILFRKALVEYAMKYGVTKAAIRYKTNRQYVYRWIKRYDGTPESLQNQSRRPKSHPNQHTPSEIKLIQDMRRRNPHVGLVVFWVKLRGRGYTRSITGLYRVLCRINGQTVKLPNPKYIPKPYEQMLFPGQRVQIDVKYVPSSCLVNGAAGQKFFQYTAIDEYSRYRYIEAFEEHNTYASAVFLDHMLKAFPFQVLCVQTDNGPEFTKQFTKASPDNLTLFEAKLEQYGIEYKRIRAFTPRHNGKVERSHRKDNEYFYASHRFYSFEDFKQQLAVYSRKYNQFPMRPLGWKSPLEYVKSFLETGEVF